MKECCECGLSAPRVRALGERLVECAGCADLICTGCAEVVTDEDGRVLYTCGECYLRELQKIVERS